MARWENEDVSNLNVPNPISSQESFIGLHGKPTTEEHAITKSVVSSDGSTRFYIKYGRGELLDPYQADSSYTTSRSRANLYKFKKVSQEAFENYNKYLESKNRLFFTRARRSLMEN